DARVCGCCARGQEEEHTGDPDEASHRGHLNPVASPPMRIKVIADVHGDLETVLREAAACDVLLLLGDLINVIDYSNAGGILGEVYGSEVVKEWSALRSDGRFDEARAVLREASKGREQEFRELMFRRIDEQTREFCERVPDNVIVTYGNVDVPDLVRKY